MSAIIKQMRIIVCIFIITGGYGCISTSQLLEMQSRITEQQQKIDALNKKSLQNERNHSQNSYEVKQQKIQQGCELLYDYYQKGYVYGLSTGRNQSACSQVGEALFEEISQTSYSTSVGAAIAIVTAAGCNQSASYQNIISFESFEQVLCR